MDINFKHYHSGKLVTTLFVLLITCTALVNWLGPIIGTYIPPSFAASLDNIKEHINVLSPTFLVALIMAWINKSFWKFSVMSWLVDLPNLNGRYKGTLTSSWIDTEKNSVISSKSMDCIYEIKQDASKLVINTYFREQGKSSESSKGTMISGEIVKQADDSFKIYFIFDNTPDILDKAKGAHRGASVFTYYPDKKQLKGDYFNDRRNIGTIDVTLVGKKLLYRFE